jgi:DNA-binding NtrC family response regulator
MNHQPRVLAVDDDKLIRLNLALVLGREGLQVDTASSCQEARVLLGACAYDIVLTDLDLPDETGLEVIRIALALAPGAKVIVVTGSSSSLGLPGMKIDGADAIVFKPFALCDIVDDVKRVLGWPAPAGERWRSASTNPSGPGPSRSKFAGDPGSRPPDLEQE